MKSTGVTLLANLLSSWVTALLAAWVTALLLAIFLTACAAPAPVLPPLPVEVRVPVPVPCSVPDPECAVPAYDTARKEMSLDLRVRLMRAEVAQREECVQRYREALEACR